MKKIVTWLLILSVVLSFVPALPGQAATNEEIIWNFFKSQGFTDAGVAGIMGNLQQESAFLPTNLEQAANNKSGYSDARFTEEVDNGTITREEFISSQRFSAYTYTTGGITYYTYGYGLAQWTFYSRKAALYDYAKSRGASIGDLNMQLSFMMKEMSASLKNLLKTTADVADACLQFHNIYEGSADTAAMIQRRINYALAIYDKYSTGPKLPGKPVLLDMDRIYTPGQSVVFKWSATSHTTHYNMYVEHRDYGGTWVPLHEWNHVENGYAHAFDEGTYRVRLQAVNAGESGAPVTDGDWVTFTVESHIHDRGYFAYYEDVHPHPDCYECSLCGEIWTDTDSSNRIKNCLECQRPDAPKLIGMKDSYYTHEPITVDWIVGSNTTHCNYWLYQRAGSDWALVRKEDYAEKPLTETLAPGDYRVQIVAVNSNYWEEDGSDWLWQSSEYAFFSVTRRAPAFGDVKETDYFCDPVSWAVDNGITAGTSASTFSPTNTCTRAQVVTFLWRAAGEPIVKSEKPFTDVPETEYYYDAVLWAVEKGITLGISATEFAPESPCTRAQVATFLWRYAGNPAPASAENPFQDVSSGEYYYTPVLWAVENGITAGTASGTFSPNAPCTRAQIVTFLYRHEMN